MSNKDGRIRKNITIGSLVQIVLKQDQKTGHLTRGVVVEILTPGAKHPHGIKVRLKSNQVGRVKKVLSVNQGYIEHEGSKPFLPWEVMKGK